MTTTTAVPIEDLRSEALGRVRDYTDPEGVNKRATALLAANQKTYAAMRSANADFEHLVAFSDDYDEILQAALAAVDSVRMFNAAEKIAAELRHHVNYGRVVKPTYDDAATRPALNFLDEQLRDLMRTVREQEPALEGVADSRSALRSGGAAQDAWAVLEAQAERYEEIRAVQRHITILLPGEDGAPLRIQALEWSGHLKNSFDREASWVDIRRVSYRTGSRGLEVGEPAWIEWAKGVPFVAFERDSKATFPADPIAYLRWISADDKAWVPGVDELMRYHELAHSMLSSVPLNHRERAKAAYFDERGITPLPAHGSYTDARGRVRGGSFE